MGTAAPLTFSCLSRRPPGSKTVSRLTPHVLHSQDVLLNSGRRYRVPLCKYNCYKNSFFPLPVKLISERVTQDKQEQGVYVGNCAAWQIIVFLMSFMNVLCGMCFFVKYFLLIQSKFLPRDTNKGTVDFEVRPHKINDQRCEAKEISLSVLKIYLIWTCQFSYKHFSGHSLNCITPLMLETESR